MAVPSFTRQTYANGGPPAINASNLNRVELFLEEVQAYLVATEAMLNPPGVVKYTASSSAPTGWLICDGAAVSRTTYAGLFSAIGTTFGSGDGSTTFNLPDLRETAVVGVGTRGSGVTAHDIYTLGQFKDDQGQGHKHLTTDSGLGMHWTNPSGTQATSTGTAWSASAGLQTGTPTPDGTNGTPRTGTTTHGKQIGLNGIIKT